MKKIMLLSICFCMIAVSVAYAHPPSDIQITFDTATNGLTAVIMHKVFNPESHYIKKVDVAINGKESSHYYSKQDNNNEQTVVLHLPGVIKGDVISVEGYCSISGTLTKEITVQ